jgi:hypothetical protein
MEDSSNIGLLILGALYLLPGIIASARKHKNRDPIFIVNLFFGWTFIGWVGCLAWSLSHQERPALAKQPASESQLGKWIESK